jgi:transposase
LRTLLVAGAMALLSHSKTRKGTLDLWGQALIEKNKPTKLVALALANKMARIAWALVTRGEILRSPPLAA